MKIVLVLAAFVAVAVTAPEGDRPTPIPLLQYDEKRDDFGQFSLSYVTANGIKVTRQGVLKPTANKTDHVLIQSGSESYTAPDGTVYTLLWTADEDGYVAKGDHLPTTPSSV